MSLEELAARLDQMYGLSMSTGHLSKIETRQKPVLDVQLQAIADALGVAVCDLFPERKEHGGPES